MVDYVVTCAVINVLVLLAVQGLKQAPARYSVWVLQLALLSWLVPWHVLPALHANPTWLLDAGDIKFSDPIIVSVPVAIPAAARDSLLVDWQVWHLAALVLSIGALLFCHRLYQYQRFIHGLKSNAHPYHHTAPYTVFLADLASPAIATGLFKPVIWLDRRMIERQELASVLMHEITHVRQGDLRWLWLLCLIECLFWWNPLCWLLGKTLRQQLELRCDEICAAMNPHHYQRDLASLLLCPLQTIPPSTEQKPLHSGSQVRTQSAQHAPILHVAHHERFTMIRVKLLNKEKVMKKNHLVLLASLLSISAVASTQIGQSAPMTEPSSASRFSPVAQAQMAELKDFAKRSIKADDAELARIVDELMAWQQQHLPSVNKENGALQLQAFTLLANIQHRREQYQALMDSFQRWYPQEQQVPYFLRNITASTYLKMQQPELALQQLQILEREIGDGIKPGSLQLLARVYIEQGDYQQALATLAHPNADQSTYSKMMKYFIYSQLQDTAQLAQIKAQLPAELANAPAALPSIGLPLSPLLAKR